MLAAERQQLPGEPCGAVRRLPNLLGVAGQRRVFLYMIQQQFAITEDDVQQIVKVMGHSAGQPADGLHFLRVE